MRRFEVAVIREFCDYIEIEAEDEKDARKKLQSIDVPLTDLVNEEFEINEIEEDAT